MADGRAPLMSAHCEQAEEISGLKITGWV